MFIDGKYQEHTQPLDGDVSRICVQLKVTGMGIALKPGIDAPHLWLDQTDTYAQHDQTTGEVTIVERPGALAERQCPLYMRRLVWLDLPEWYRDKQLDEVDIEARTKVALGGVATRKLSVCTWGDVTVKDVQVGEIGFLKTVQGGMDITELIAPEDSDPRLRPTIDLINVTGNIAIGDSKAAWRINQVNPQAQLSCTNVFGPHHP
ncbi:MAG TPA: hypothetical protein VD735_01130 [Candidatus Saccharimonadales bacterium]|nr:hypothetical protein [Candidatus Saccharimonadales bacterium]